MQQNGAALSESIQAKDVIKSTCCSASAVELKYNVDFGLIYVTQKHDVTSRVLIFCKRSSIPLESFN